MCCWGFGGTFGGAFVPFCCAKTGLVHTLIFPPLPGMMHHISRKCPIFMVSNVVRGQRIAFGLASARLVAVAGDLGPLQAKRTSTLWTEATWEQNAPKKIP